MGSTTLFTFLFEHPTRVQTVELLGSWDNFSKPYQLQRDRRRGRGVWSGCYTFDNIICDGDLKNVGERRSGALRMGGTYWYYYNVDGDERHNPAEPSTTVCPLLPGQRLNVLDVPREFGNQQTMDSADAFTRNPKDKFLTPVPPVPPKVLPSPRVGDFCKEPYTVPTVSLTTPRSATYPYTTPAYSPGYVRHTRSASTTPALSSTALFADFKGLKEKFARKRSASHARSGSRNIHHLEIGAPTLISTTADEVNLVPLTSLQQTLVPSLLPTPRTSRSLPTPTAPQTATSLPESVRAKLREFSPLGSHPIDPAKNLDPSSLFAGMPEDHYGRRPRSRSDVAPTTAGSLCAPASLVRANSTDSRRMKLFCNEPWISSPRLPRQHEIDPEAAAEDPTTAPVLQRPSVALEPLSDNARPTSSHGGDRSSSLRNSALDKDKDLPPLPRYLVPAPLYACSSASSSPKFQSEPEEPEEPDYEEIQVEETRFQILSERKGHFSIYTSESGTFSSPTSDDEDVYSPTFSSWTSECSEAGSPNRYSLFSISDYIRSPTRDSAFIEEAFEEQEQQHSAATQNVSPSPPKLEELRLSAFGPSLFNVDIQHADSAPRRKAACFGLGFQSYKLPDDEAASKVTVTEQTLHAQPAIHGDRGSSASHAEKLVNDFGFLGDSVK
ncbi:hypothetical protein BU23DRAFT_2357 [Bimuria novae-zelandiae CBS 107.79]|uniref:AMP-activated protein kinase glycogen-binding domain-containing protein n=1 Tax=Bimuria novae-zelandiae CBS 107.79 TaxID=1447943 RepID=A0A6A5VU38_9PLEO|nr:hypothetical protein BU23DRAFT_2357 [Bimuria novae-zelandiae CBS 107.79]